MDLVDQFLPDVKRHRTLRALVAFAAVQSTYKGPFTPGSALCLVYTFAQNEGGGLMRRVKGGMGSLSEALARSIADKGGEVRLKSPVRRVLIEGGRAVGVELRDERAVFSSEHFATMQGATNGDFTHGLIHPEQMIAGRLLVPGSAHATPIARLYLCGAACHPGPGVTFLPGYGAAYEVMEALGARRGAEDGNEASHVAI
jgi:phytoene dehydrogenase-like protein